MLYASCTRSSPHIGALFRQSRAKNGSFYVHLKGKKGVRLQRCHPLDSNRVCTPCPGLSDRSCQVLESFKTLKQAKFHRKYPDFLVISKQTTAVSKISKAPFPQPPQGYGASSTRWKLETPKAVRAGSDTMLPLPARLTRDDVDRALLESL